MIGLCEVPQRELQQQEPLLNSYPEINLHCETHVRANSSFEGWRNVLVPVNEGIVKRITRTFFELGFHEALNEARDKQTAASTPLLSAIAELSSQVLCFLERIKARILPQREHGTSSIARYSETRDWMRSFIRCIVWHPNCFKIAVAGSDDIIRIYTEDPAVVPALRSSSQKCITSMVWRPFCVGELAVGCQRGICLWTIDSNMHITRPSSQTALLRHPNKSAVTSVQWNTDGTLLASASIGDTDVFIWNVDKMQSTVLKRVGHPCSILKWSPDGTCLFSATVGTVFRVWSMDKDCRPERWTINSGYIQSACWAPCSSFLLFVTSDDPLLYRLQFLDEQLFTSETVAKLALPIANLSKRTVGHREVGGQPQALAWDPNGLYLAITFKDSPCVAIFRTCVQKFNLTISPICYIHGIGAVECPSFICYQSKNRTNTATVLTIGWSSGRVQYVPLNDL